MKNIKAPIYFIGLAGWTAAWLGAGWVILNHLFPEGQERRK